MIHQKWQDLTMKYAILGVYTVLNIEIIHGVTGTNKSYLMWALSPSSQSLTAIHLATLRAERGGEQRVWGRKIPNICTMYFQVNAQSYNFYIHCPYHYYENMHGQIESRNQEMQRKSNEIPLHFPNSWNWKDPKVWGELNFGSQTNSHLWGKRLGMLWFNSNPNGTLVGM